MRKQRVSIAFLCVAMAFAMLVLGACQGNEESANVKEGVAATVNSVDIPEQEITDAIEVVRSQYEEYSDDAAWAQTLASSGLSPDSLRETFIQSKVEEVVLMQAAQEKGYTVNEENVDAQLEQTKNTITEGETWPEVLQKYGYKDEAAYRELLEVNDLLSQLKQGFEIEEDEDALKQYIIDNPTLVEGYNANTGELLSAETFDLNTVPEDVLAQYKQLWILDSKDAVYEEWSSELIDSAEVIIYDMPADVPYNVDMSLAEEPSTTGDEDELEEVIQSN